MSVAVVGAGLAGCEAALVLARNGVEVELFEMRPGRMTPAHTTALPAELVCSNSLKSCEMPSAHGLLKHELRVLKSPLLELAYASRVPAAKALAVDRKVFSENVLGRLRECLSLRLTQAELYAPPSGVDACIIAAGPLVSDGLAQWIAREVSSGALYFYDAIAPVVATDSIDVSKVFSADRWGSGAGDYLNCPFDREQYTRFYEELIRADEIAAHAFEDARFFEACLPIEVAARRGFDALRFGPLRPVGFTDPNTGRRPFAVCQLRNETRGGESRGLVGFQTRLRQEEQRRVFRLIPGLEHAEFLRYGSIHRNTYLDSPSLLGPDLSFTARPSLFLAGQLCGNEGYTESIATGHLAALFVLARLRGVALEPPPPTTALGALLRHVTSSPVRPFTPTNINFGLIDPLPPAEGGNKIGRERKQQMLCARAMKDLHAWIAACSLSCFGYHDNQ